MALPVKCGAVKSYAKCEMFNLKPHTIKYINEPGCPKS
jgi:hypothetical protein